MDEHWADGWRPLISLRCFLSWWLKATDLLPGLLLNLYYCPEMWLVCTCVHSACAQVHTCVHLCWLVCTRVYWVCAVSSGGCLSLHSISAKIEVVTRQILWPLSGFIWLAILIQGQGSYGLANHSYELMTLLNCKIPCFANPQNIGGAST